MHDFFQTYMGIDRFVIIREGASPRAENEKANFRERN